MICFPNAKINLGLRVLRKRADGFHDIETVFIPIPLCDILEIVLVDEYMDDYPSFEMNDGHKLFYSYSGDNFVGDPRNDLTIKACLSYVEMFGVSSNVHLHLHKKIPSGAGLGGGSSDAANALLLLNELEGEKSGLPDLMRMATALGSDCPFFLINKPCHATGKGELLSPIDFSLKGFHLVLVKPDFGVSTAEAYAGVAISKEPDLIDLAQLLSKSSADWRNQIVNDFEKGVFEKHPKLLEIKNGLYERGAFFAAMSGSGSTMFGLFREEPDVAGLFESCFTWKFIL